MVCVHGEDRIAFPLKCLNCSRWHRARWPGEKVPHFTPGPLQGAHTNPSSLPPRSCLAVVVVVVVVLLLVVPAVGAAVVVAVAAAAATAAVAGIPARGTVAPVAL